MVSNPVLSAVRTERGLAGWLGAELGITREAVWMWKKVPPKHAFRVAKLMRLPIKVVCPEIIPETKKRKRAACSR